MSTDKTEMDVEVDPMVQAYLDELNQVIDLVDRREPLAPEWIGALDRLSGHIKNL